MALPTILVDGNDGAASDSAASGAGPTSAITGSSASTSGDGLTVTLDGSPDLSGVATDGSHVIYLADSTAGNRNFGKITGKDDGADTVTVSDAFGTSLSGLSWAIGGVRATVFGTNSVKLLENNSNNGDMMPGWILEIQAGHTESFSSTVRTRRAGDTTDGAITIKGSSETNRPILTYTGTSIAWIVGAGNYQRFENLEFRSTTTTSYCFSSGSGGRYSTFRNLKIAHSSNTFSTGFFCNTDPWKIEHCEIAYCTTTGINLTSGIIDKCRIHNNATGIDISGVTGSSSVLNCMIYSNTAVGLDMGVINAHGSRVVVGNVFYANAAGGIDFTDSSERMYGSLIVKHNILVSNTGGYGIEWVTVGIAELSAYGVLWDSNAYYSNTSGPSDIGTYESAGIGGETNRVILTADPFVNAAGGDFNLNLTSGGGLDLRETVIAL